jgi:uncharacterized protein YndB with AHSA1/START domain
MIKKILLGVAALVAAFLVIVAIQPGEFTITRSATIAAPPAAVFAHVNDLHKWQAWSPWAKLDPDATNTFEGPSAGEGSAMTWSGNAQVGEGTMTITESKAAEHIGMRLDFRKPMESTSTTTFGFKGDDSGTVVTWSMTGTNNFIGKAMCLIMNCEKMLGEQFDEGLANLAVAVSTAQPKAN